MFLMRVRRVVYKSGAFGAHERYISAVCMSCKGVSIVLIASHMHVLHARLLTRRPIICKMRICVRHVVHTRESCHVDVTGALYVCEVEK